MFAVGRGARMDRAMPVLAEQRYGNRPSEVVWILSVPTISRHMNKGEIVRHAPLSFVYHCWRRPYHNKLHSSDRGEKIDCFSSKRTSYACEQKKRYSTNSRIDDAAGSLRVSIVAEVDCLHVRTYFEAQYARQLILSHDRQAAARCSCTLVSEMWHHHCFSCFLSCSPHAFGWFIQQMD